MNWIIISGILGLIGSMLAWLFNEWQKRIEKLISEKEKRYEKLISLIPSFGDRTENDTNPNDFIRELHLCWMYCPDIIIQKGNKFIQTMTPENKKLPDYQQIVDISKGELVLEIRRDLMLTRKLFKSFHKNKDLTKLKREDFKDVYYRKKLN